MAWLGGGCDRVVRQPQQIQDRQIAANRITTACPNCLLFIIFLLIKGDDGKFNITSGM
jgi:hypothetical protein